MRKIEGRSTVYNKITTPERVKQINFKNKEIMNDFLDYLASIDRSPQTIRQYSYDLKLFFTWVLENIDNKEFIKITKREFARFQNYALNTYGWSPKRLRRIKSVISSLSNYIENILDEEDEYANYRSVIKKIESPVNQTVREKTVLTDEQVNLLLDTLVERQEYERAVAIAILCYSGMRKSELLQMKMEYFDKNHLEFNCLYKTDKIRAKGRGVKGKVIHKYVMNKVDKYIELWRKQREELDIDSEWVFVIKRNDKWDRRTDIESWKIEFSNIINVPFYYHCLRHKLCSELVSQNIPSEVIREFFMWDSADMISVYNDNSAADNFGKYFNSDGIITQEQKSIDKINIK